MTYNVLYYVLKQHTFDLRIIYTTSKLLVYVVKTLLDTLKKRKRLNWQVNKAYWIDNNVLLLLPQMISSLRRKTLTFNGVTFGRFFSRSVCFCHPETSELWHSQIVAESCPFDELLHANSKRRSSSLREEDLNVMRRLHAYRVCVLS